MREVTRFVLFVNVAPMKSHELRKFHEIFVYSIGATFSNKTNLVTSGPPLFTIFEIAKIQSNLGLRKINRTTAKSALIEIALGKTELTVFRKIPWKVTKMLFKPFQFGSWSFVGNSNLSWKCYCKLNFWSIFYR